MTAHSLPLFRTELLGKRVIKAESDAEGVGLSFEDGWRIAIWNAVDLRIADSIIDVSNIRKLEDKMLRQFIGNEVEERMIFGDDVEVELVIHLDGEACRGPESMVVFGPNDYIVVWN